MSKNQPPRPPGGIVVAGRQGVATRPSMTAPRIAPAVVSTRPQAAPITRQSPSQFVPQARTNNSAFVPKSSPPIAPSENSIKAPCRCGRTLEIRLTDMADSHDRQELHVRSENYTGFCECGVAVSLNWTNMDHISSVW